MQAFLSILGVIIGLIVLGLTMWIVVPAQHTVLWLVAVVTSEWSLHFGILALITIALGIYAIISQRIPAGVIAIVLGMFALGFTAYPTLASIGVARINDVRLSSRQYFLGAGPMLQPEIETFTYRKAGADSLALDVYSTPADTMRRPAVVVIHGGSWNGGNRSDFPKWNIWLVQLGYVVFDIDYQLSPQPNWQTATRDVQAAVRWVKSRAEEHHVDPDHIALMGRSAGGHLALLAAYTAATNDSLPDATVQAVVSFYGPTDLAWGYANPANPKVIDGQATLRKFTGGTPTLNPEVYELASPIHHAIPEQPATLLIHGLKDQLVRSGHTTRLMQALSDPEKHQALYLPYAQHGFDYNFNGWGAQLSQAIIHKHLTAHLSRETSN